MALIVETRIVSDVAILDLTGKFGVGESPIKSAVESLVRQGRRQFIFNLAGVPYIGSWGITQLMSAYITISRVDGTMVLAAPSQTVRDVFAITSLDNIVPLYKDEAEALRHLSS